MVDNFERIKKLLTFDSEDHFYFVQIIQRKKDNNTVKGTNNTNRTVKTYRIDSIKKLDELKEEMIDLADWFNARVGINLNKRSYEKAAFHTLKKIANQMSNKNYKNVKSAYNSVCGLHDSVVDRIWLIDIDTKDEWYISDVEDAIKCSMPNIGDYKKILGRVPSKSGIHLITKPFNQIQFKEYLDTICGFSEYPEIHKNNPTNLYIPK